MKVALILKVKGVDTSRKRDTLRKILKKLKKGLKRLIYLNSENDFEEEKKLKVLSTFCTQLTIEKLTP